MQRSALCKSRRELSNAYLLAKFGFDTAENEPSKVCRVPLTQRRHYGLLPARDAKVLCKFMKAAEPGFKFTSICINKNYSAKRHQDANNLGESRMIALGSVLSNSKLERIFSNF